MDNYKGDFLKMLISFFILFFYPQIPDFQIVVSRPNIVLS